jgi:quercetin dioxygenase-like cupin family protein
MRGNTGTWKIPFCVALVVSVGFLIAGSQLSSQTPGKGADDDFRFRPDHEREALGGQSAYRKFQQQEGIPVHQGFAINVYTVKIGPWKRMGQGVSGAYVDLDGAGGIVNLTVTEIAPGAQTRPEKHLFEEQVIIVRGEGEFHLWQTDPAKKVVVPWRRGSLFAPPLNTWHQFINKGKEPVRMAAVTDLPLKLDIFRNPDFVFNNNYNFTDRYNGQPDYFDPEKSIDYSPKTAHSLSIVNLVRDAWTWRLFHAGQGYGDIDRHFLLSDNSMTGHIEAWPVGAYQRAHRHGPGASIVHMGGPGYTLLWPMSLGTTPWKDGRGAKVVREDWKEGTFLIPPINWYHQHFAIGPANAKFIMLGSGPSNEKYRITTRVLRGEDVGHMILFKDEDPYVRQLFEKEVAKSGAKVLMPPVKELIVMERDSIERDIKAGMDCNGAQQPQCARIPLVVGNTTK